MNIIDKKLEEEFTGYIKIFKWMDPNMGYGEGETVGIFKVKKEWYAVTPKGFREYYLKDKFKKLLGVYSMDVGYRFITLNEIKELYEENNQKINNLQRINNQIHLFLKK